METERVCVTGAGGYLASWVVKFLLAKGYMVHGTLRDPSAYKNSHLEKMENAAENLKLFKADLMEYASLCAAIGGCSGVFHVACPVPLVPAASPEVIEPAVTGTMNVLKACSEAGVKKVVLVSSVAASCHNPNFPKDHILDENSWSDLEYCEAIKYWYGIGKTKAEKQAWDYAEKNQLIVVTVCPSYIIGPLLQPVTNNATNLHFLKFLRDGLAMADNKIGHFVDVRDVAEAQLLVYENPEAKGRYMCTSHFTSLDNLIHRFKARYPYFNYPKSFREEVKWLAIDTEKLRNLGWNYRPLDKTIDDIVKVFELRGDLVGIDQSYESSNHPFKSKNI